MAKLIYLTPASLDGFIADETFSPAWSPPSDGLFAFICDLLRPVGTYLYGRKMYQTMAVWQTPDVIPFQTPAKQDFARIWQSADKIVYSRSLQSVSTPGTQLVRDLDPQAIRDLKAHSPHDISVGGPNLAAQVIRAGLVDEYQVWIVPAMLGRGNRILPGGVSPKLDLLDERRFADGTVYLRYRTQP